MAKRKVNVALIGYQFMGKAHSNAYRQVGRFFDLDVEPVMKVLVGRTEHKVKAAAELLHDRGLDMINRGKWQEALRLLQQAEAAYASHLPKEALSPSPLPRSASLAPLISSTVPTLGTAQESALIGVIETRRYQAIALRGVSPALPTCVTHCWP